MSFTAPLENIGSIGLKGKEKRFIHLGTFELQGDLGIEAIQHLAGKRVTGEIVYAQTEDKIYRGHLTLTPYSEEIPCNYIERVRNIFNRSISQDPRLNIPSKKIIPINLTESAVGSLEDSIETFKANPKKRMGFVFDTFVERKYKLSLKINSLLGATGRVLTYGLNSFEATGELPRQLKSAEGETIDFSLSVLNDGTSRLIGTYQDPRSAKVKGIININLTEKHTNLEILNKLEVGDTLEVLL